MRPLTGLFIFILTRQKSNIMKRINLFLTLAVAFGIISTAWQPAVAERVDVAPLAAKIRQVGPKGKGHQAAIAAVKQLSNAEVGQLPEVLAAMDGAGPLATNWLRAVVETIAQRQLNRGGKLPTKVLEAYLADQKHAPRARRLVYELIAGVDKTAHDRLIPGMLNDPSLELRRDAVAHAIAGAESLVKADKKPAAIKSYRTALTAARDLDQIKAATKQLRDLGETVNLPTHFGFVMRWKLIGPFDNSGKKGFAVAYPPEKEVVLDGQYEGKDGKVQWTEHTTSDDYGTVDLNKVQAKHKGAITYAYAEFVSDSDQDGELRLGCINGNKVWLNGKLLTANHVYHSNTSIDQYIGRGQLKKGRNTILLKICQNEQTESWAQKWQYQLRVCDQFGTAILSQDRPVTKTAALSR